LEESKKALKSNPTDLKIRMLSTNSPPLGIATVIIRKMGLKPRPRRTALHFPPFGVEGYGCPSGEVWLPQPPFGVKLASPRLRGLVRLAALFQ
jgi:hypothetical protein